MFASLAFFLLLTLGQAAPPDNLAIVRGHYAAAAYEEALAHVAGLGAAAVTPEIEQFRALCLLALGRNEEGQQSFERLVRQAPLYVIPEAEISPRMFAVFRDVRRRVLPLVVRERYNRGKSAFDEKQYDTAVVELRDLMRLLNDPDAATDATTFADLRQLTDGFLRLAEAELALAARAAAPPPPLAPPGPVEAAPATPAPAATRDDGLRVTRIVVYSRADREVVPPVELERFMPPWNPPAVMARFLEYRGELEVVVDEAGRVEGARMLRQTIPSYDLTLIGATAGWRFAPARRNGEPVKFRLTFEVVLAPNR
jgi:hypothetical protein